VELLDLQVVAVQVVLRDMEILKAQQEALEVQILVAVAVVLVRTATQQTLSDLHHQVALAVQVLL